MDVASFEENMKHLKTQGSERHRAGVRENGSHRWKKKTFSIQRARRILKW